MPSTFLQVLNLAVTTFFVILGLSMVSPILPIYVESFQISYSLVGLTISGFAIARLILDLPASVLAQKYDKRKIMLSGLVLVIIASLMAAEATNFITLFISRLIEGAGSALYITTATTFLAHISGSTHRGRYMSLYSGMLLLGSIFGPTFGGTLAGLYNIRAPFIAYAMVTALGIPATLVLPNLSPSSSVPRASLHFKIQDVREVLTAPSYLLATGATFALFFARTGIPGTILPLYAANNLGLNVIDTGIVLTISAIATAATMIPVGAISDRLGRRDFMILCLILSGVTTAFIPLFPNVPDFLITIFLYGAFIGLSGPVAAYITDVSPPNQVDLSLGLYRAISDLGYTLGPVLLGFIIDASMPNAGTGSPITPFPFFFAAILMCLIGLSLFKAHDPIKTAKRRDPALLETS